MVKLLFALLCLAALLCALAAFGILLHAGSVAPDFLFLGAVAFSIEASRRLP